MSRRASASVPSNAGCAGVCRSWPTRSTPQSARLCNRSLRYLMPVDPEPDETRPAATARPPPVVADHELIVRIGEGAYGEVWLARNVTGAYRAVKIVYR